VRWAGPVTRSELLLIGGRSGVGKTSVAAELHEQLVRLDVHHGWIEGDNLDLAHPTPWLAGHQLAEANLAAMWANYRAIGHTRLIYTNTASVRVEVIASLTSAMGDDPVVHGVLLTASDGVARLRLGRREIGSGLDDASARSRRAARELDENAPSEVLRLDTDERSVVELASRIIVFAGWRPRNSPPVERHRAPRV
jgi:hypothetical protein